MKRLVIIALLLAAGLCGFAQAPHIYEHDYPVVTEENPRIRALIDSVSIDNLKANIEHLCNYHNRRFDSRHIYDVQDWLVSCYQSFGVDTVMLHDFKVNKPGFPEETADNILAVQWGTLTPEEYVICGILETARLLSHYTFDRTIIYANWCAEEIGLVGSAAYAHDMAEQRMDIVGYFNLDMTGYLEEGSDIHIHLMYTGQDSLLAKMVYSFSHTYFPEMPIRQNWLAWGDSDYSSFNRNGYPAVHPFEDVLASSPYIHSRQDVLGLSVNNLEQSKRFTELNLGLVATLAGINNYGVAENEAINVTLYPNPARDVLNIVAENGLQRITLSNLMGQQLTTVNLNGENRYRLDTSDFASGIYMVHIVTGSGATAKRVVLQ